VAVRRHERERGQALVEFALAIPITLLAVLAVFDFGRALYTYDLVSSAARIGSRYAIVHGSACTLAAPACPATSSSIQAFVLTKVNGIDPTLLNVSASWKTAPGCPGTPFQGPQCVVTVQVSYPYSFLATFGWTIDLTSSSQMPISQ